MLPENALEKKIPFEQPPENIKDLLKAINAGEDKDILDVPSTCQTLDAFSLIFKQGSFYLGTMSLKRLKKGGWGGAKNCTSSAKEKISDFVAQIYSSICRKSSRWGTVDYYELKTDVDFYLLKELISRKLLFWERNTSHRITFAPTPMFAEFEWFYKEHQHAYVFQMKKLSPPFIFVTKPYPLIFNLAEKIFYEVESPIDQHTLVSLLDMPAIKPEYTHYLVQHLENKHLPKIDLPKAFLVKKVQPIPILTFKQIYEGYEKYAGAELSFKYENKECAYQSSLKKFEQMQEGNLIHLERDKAAEEAFVKNVLLETMENLRVKTWSYYAGSSYQQKEGSFVPKKVNTATTPAIKETYWHKFLSKEVNELKRAGCFIRVEESFPYQSVAEDAWYVDLEPSEMNWFDTEIGVVINEEKINLLPILLRSIRASDTTFLEGYKMDVPIRLDDGREITIKRDRINQLLTLLRSLMKIGSNKESKSSNTLKLHLLDALQLDHFRTNDFATADWTGSKTLLDFAEKLKDFKGIDSIDPPKSLQAILRPYQQEGLNWLQFLRKYHLNGILADEMGLGKTVQTLAHFAVEKEQHRLKKPILLVVPTSLVPNWESEILKFLPTLSFKILHGAQRDFNQLATFDLLITTYSLLYRDVDQLRKHPYDTIVLDEAQNIKNKNTQVVKVLMHLQAEHRLCLTGTPLENHLGELWSLFNFLMPGFLGDDRYFQKEFRTKIEKGNDEASKKMLAIRIKPFMLRRTKAQIAKDLPEKTEIMQKCELNEQQRDLYEIVRLAMHQKVQEEIEKKGIHKSQIVILDALLKLRQVCCDPRLLKMKHKVTESAKLKMLIEMLEEMVEEGRKILIFSQFTGMLDLISQELQAMNISYVRLCGDTKDRKTPVEEFQQGTIPVFLISLKAGGVGLNLTAADVVIHYDPWWNPAVENQATDRAHRLGQQKRVFVYKLVTKDTLEEKILELQAKKASIAAALFDHENTAAQITQEDVNALFR